MLFVGIFKTPTPEEQIFCSGYYFSKIKSAPVKQNFPGEFEKLNVQFCSVRKDHKLCEGDYHALNSMLSLSL